MAVFKVRRSEQHFGRSKRARSARVPHGIPTLFPPRNRRRIFAAKQTRGTQDVNDPEQPVGRVAGPYTGSFTSWVPFLR